MLLTKLHAKLLSSAFESILGTAKEGSMAYIRCLTGDIVESLADSPIFAPKKWQIWRVADSEQRTRRTITADSAVEMRESKSDPVLLLVDTSKAGAGMDGIFSAAREVKEKELFDKAIQLAANEVKPKQRKFAECAVKKAKSRGRRISISPWTEFDFYTRSAVEERHPGALLYLLGLWPVKETEELNDQDVLETASRFVNRLLGSVTSGMTPAARIGTLRLLNPSEEQKQDLEVFLRDSAMKPLLQALAELSEKPNLWINSLRMETEESYIQSFEIVPWRNQNGRLYQWSGLVQEGETDEPPAFILRPEADRTGEYSKLEVRWKARPDSMEKGSVEYRVAIVTDMDEELIYHEIAHSAKKEEKCRFTNDDFSNLNDDVLISAKVVVSVIGNESIDPQESEDFLIRFGEPTERTKGGVGKKVRTFSDGLIDLEERDLISTLASVTTPWSEDSKGFVVIRTSQRGKSFRVFRPSFIREVEKRWKEENGALGRWRVKIRASGALAEEVEFVPFSFEDFKIEVSQRSLCESVEKATGRIVERFAESGGGIAQIYDEKSNTFDIVKEFLLAWAALLGHERCNPIWGLVGTVEVQTLSGRTIGLIVLPSHPLRVAWHVGYDNLVFHARFEQGMDPKKVREEFQGLDGSMFPAFLPGLGGGNTFIFADTLGFHAVGMVLDNDKEPKASLALLASALGESETADSAPTVGKQIGDVLGKEIIKYLECHVASRLLYIHALRPGDGLTVARALGYVHKNFHEGRVDEMFEEENNENHLAFVLDLFPSEGQRGVSGRFIAEVCEKRRSGAGVPSADDQWMLQSLPAGVGINIPRLRWARRDDQNPKTAAHLAIAFDTFESRISTISESEISYRTPLFVFGLLSFFERSYTNQPSPLWHSYIPPSTEGEKHPSDRSHTELLLRIQQAINKLLSHTLGGTDSSHPVLRTEISTEKTENLRTLHDLCDWVITVDRNAGIEYFDSPIENSEIYNTYVIDCVPEREDLGCLQMITSTSNLDEVRSLLDTALDQLGLSRSLRNAKFLIEHLKSLSGRLAIRLTGQETATGELISLALVHANCQYAELLEEVEVWPSLKEGFFVPVDDVLDLLPTLRNQNNEGMQKETRPDLIYVHFGSRRALSFRFVEVKYRRHLRSARNPEDLEKIRQQTGYLRERWEAWYCHEKLSIAERAIRRAKLSRVLRFYVDKASRHSLDTNTHRRFVEEIDRMILAGNSYSFGNVVKPDRGFVFCPEYQEMETLKISPADWETQVYLFGPARFPDSPASDFHISPILIKDENIPQIQSNGNSTDIANPVYVSGKNKRILKENFIQKLDEGHDSMDAEEKSTNNERSLPKIISPNKLEILLGADIFTTDSVSWQPTIRGNPHLLVVGISGMGKTICLTNICRQLWKQRVCPIIFSYHQDIDELLSNLLGNIRFVDYNGLGFNPLRKPAQESKRTYLDVAGEMRDIFMSIYPELGDIQGEAIRQAIKESYHEKGWQNIITNQNDRTEPEFGRFFDILRNKPKPDRGLKTLMARFEELSDYGFFAPCEDRGDLWESTEPIVIRIHTTQNENLQRAFASLLFYGFYKGMFYRKPQNQISHFIVFDEAHRASRLKLISTMAQECRKYGIGLILASQKAADFQVSVFSLFANYLVLRLTDADARTLVRNVAGSDQERPLIDKIKQMEKYRGLFFSEGRRKPTCINLSRIEDT